MPEPTAPPPGGDLTPPVWAILNPKARDYVRARRALERGCADAGLGPPRIEATTIAAPGGPQARAALAEGARVVVVGGGDGTVRDVAEALAGSGVELGILPLGTANLFAHNLGLRTRVLRVAVRRALTPGATAVDVGWASWRPVVDAVGPDIEDPTGADAARADAARADAAGADPLRANAVRTDQAGGACTGAARAGADPLRADPTGRASVAPPTRDRAFLVMAGVGHDAATVHATRPEQKDRLGWLAYLTAGIARLRARPLAMRLSVDSAPARRVHLWTLIVANCGALPAGVQVVPTASPVDGVLDTLEVPLRSVLQWGSVAVKGVFGHSRDVAALRYGTARTLWAVPDAPTPLHLDGDVVGLVADLRVRVQAGALQVRLGRSGDGVRAFGSRVSGWSLSLARGS